MRLDVYLTENNFFTSRNKASEAVARGEVFVNGKPVLKSSKEVDELTDKIHIKQQEKPFVSLGGYKLDIAVKKFKPQIDGKVFIDVGASTGGFTDCLLRNGAKKVYCVDVGENLLDKSIANDKRVVVMDRTNARFLSAEHFDERAFGIVIDCSFISLEYILPALVPLFENDGFILALIKPQFELQEKQKLKNGILRSDKQRYKIIERLYQFIQSLSLCPKNIVCTTTDSKKNLEYIILIEKSGTPENFEKFIKKLD